MSVKNGKRFAEIERISGDYFSCHLAPIMGRVQDELSHKQAEEMRDYSTSAAGVLSFMATAGMPSGDPYSTLKVTGEWNSKTTEDYLAMCKKSVLADKSIQQDLALMAEEWRSTVVGEIGRTRYDALCKQLGCDLAYAYIDHRVEQMMIDKMVKDKMPKSSADYIIRKAGQSSLFGLTAELSKSPLAAEIERRGEAAYKPSKTEKVAGRVVGATADAVALGGASTWASFAKFVGIDVVLGAGMDRLCRKGTKQAVSVEECISKGVFGSGKNVFTEFRKEASGIKKSEDSYIVQTNSKLKKKIPTMDFDFMGWTKQNEGKNNVFPWMKGNSLSPTLPNREGVKREGKYKDVPLIVAPGQEDAYLEEKAKREKTNSVSSEKCVVSSDHAAQETDGRDNNEETTGAQDNEQDGDDTEQATQTNESGWSGLLANFGLDGFSDIGKNLGYVLAMLPDIVVGLFTGKTKSLNIQNCAVPLASIVAGMFVKNPILKMLLIGLGGANLINKAGHEVLEAKRKSLSPTLSQGEGANASYSGNAATRYKQYADEALNPRIKNPMLRGHCLIANIDNVPCTVQLSDAVVEAYRAEALPLNTLANAVVEKGATKSLSPTLSKGEGVFDRERENRESRLRM